jgi:hypothetical protein
VKKKPETSNRLTQFISMLRVGRAETAEYKRNRTRRPHDRRLEQLLREGDDSADLTVAVLFRLLACWFAFRHWVIPAWISLESAEAL